MLEVAPFMLWVVIGFLAFSLLLYCLLAGADFGAGVLEIFMSGERREAQRGIIGKAMGPVWEANHIWLILIVVILFTGFPEVYSRVSVNLHIPLTAMLLGVIARGCSFTFRHYDAVKGRSQRMYSGFFIFSSVWTPFCLGVVMGALTLGNINPAAAGYAEGFIHPWFRPFPLALGLFTIALFAFLAAVYLIGESPEGELRLSFVRKARWASAATVLAGGVVFVSAHLDGLELIPQFLRSKTAMGCLLLATLSLPLLWLALRNAQIWRARMLAGMQVILILAGWMWLQFPVLVHMPQGDLTFFNAHAPERTLGNRAWALIVGGGFILPALFYLVRGFKLDEE